MLDSRLKLCVEMVSGIGITCDVGTDHAYLACELVKSGKCQKVIATDINSGPLNAARQTSEKYGVSDKIELVLTNGLQGINPENISDIVIAGMGGETIIGILNGHKWLKDGVNIILQPMSKDELLRKWLYDEGFQITEEKVAEDDKFIYSVMKVIFVGEAISITDFSAIVGRIDYLSDNVAKKYVMRRADKLLSIAKALYSAGKINIADEKYKLALQLKNVVENSYVSTNDVFNLMDFYFPFKYQEKWDNSGFLVGNPEMAVHNILLTLDITNESIYEAMKKKCELIISHHPVIFEPLKQISYNSPVNNLIKNNISAICSHTCLDVADNGVNDAMYNIISKTFKVSDSSEVFEISTSDGHGYGKVCELENECDTAEFAEKLKIAFNCSVVRFSRNVKKVKRFAFVSGSGGSMLDIAIEKKCDCLITGDVKHDVWIKAENCGLSIFDCGHFHTENIVLKRLKCVIEANYPLLNVTIADSSVDPVRYI